MCGSKREKIVGGCRRLHNEELHNLYASPSIIRSDQVKGDEMGGACSMHGWSVRCIQNFGQKT